MAFGSFELKAGGWVACEDTAVRALIRVRFAEGSEGRLEIVELHLGPGTEAVTGELLRRLNLGRLEAAGNSPEVAAELRRRIENAPAPARRATERFLEGLEPREGGEVRTAPTSAVIPMPAKSRKRPDDFYRQVAAAFAWLGMESDQPARDLAEANGVPVTTVHRWIKEARRRGLLPPARRGASVEVGS